MANQVVHKYTLTPGITELELPADAVPLCASFQGDKARLWVRHTSTGEKYPRRFCVVGTGQEFNEEVVRSIGTIFLDNLVFHVFEVK